MNIPVASEPYKKYHTVDFLSLTSEFIWNYRKTNDKNLVFLDTEGSTGFYYDPLQDKKELKSLFREILQDDVIVGSAPSFIIDSLNGFVKEDKNENTFSRNQ